MVTVEEAERLIEEENFVDLKTRAEAFTGGPILCVSKLRRTPRSATVERPHVERAFLTTSKYETAYPTGEEIERLRSIVALDRAAREDEERLRIEIVFELNRAFLKKITIKVESDAFDKAEAESWGRPMTFGGSEDERTSHGTDTAFDLDFMDHDEDEHETGESFTDHEDDAEENQDDADGAGDVDGCALGDDDAREQYESVEELAA